VFELRLQFGDFVFGETQADQIGHVTDVEMRGAHAEDELVSRPAR
jgi:hypothetical protein